MSNMNESEYLEILKSLNISGESLSTFYPQITEPIVPVSLSGTSAQDFFKWKKMRVDATILEPGDKVGKWVKLNLLEVVWVKILQELKNFGVPNTSIIKIKDELFNNSVDVLIENMDYVNKLIDKKFTDIEQAKQIKSLLLIFKTDSSIINSKYIKLLNPFTGIISEVLLKGASISLLIWKNEKQYDFEIDGMTLREKGSTNLEMVKAMPHLKIPINRIIAEFIIKNESHAQQFGLLLEQEQEVIEALRDNTIKEIVIKKNSNEKELVMTTTQIVELKDNNARKFIHILGMNQYNEIRVVTRNNKHIILENKKKKRI